MCTYVKMSKDLLKKMRCKIAEKSSQPASSGFSLFSTVSLVPIRSCCQLEVLSQVGHPVQNLILRWTERNFMIKNVFLMFGCSLVQLTLRRQQ